MDNAMCVRSFFSQKYFLCEKEFLSEDSFLAPGHRFQMMARWKHAIIVKYCANVDCETKGEKKVQNEAD